MVNKSSSFRATFRGLHCTACCSWCKRQYVSFSTCGCVNLGWQWVNPNQTKLGRRFRKCKELNTILVNIPKARFSTYADLSWSILFLRFLGSFNPTWDEDSDLEEIQRLDGDIQDTAIHKNHGDGDIRSQKIKAGNLEILGWHMVTYIWHIIYKILETLFYHFGVYYA